MATQKLNGLQAIQARVEANAEQRAKTFILGIFDNAGSYTSKRFQTIEDLTNYALAMEDEQGYKIKSFKKDDSYWGAEQKFVLNLE